MTTCYCPDIVITDQFECDELSDLNLEDICYGYKQ